MRATWHATILVAVLLTLSAVALRNESWSLRGWSGPWLLIDAALGLGLGYGVSRYSRVCATLLFGSWAINVTNAILCQKFAFSLVGVFVGVTYFAGMTGSFEYHRRFKNTRARATDGYGAQPPN
jgi:hypothetical protein